jgi:hypothetical protein
MTMSYNSLLQIIIGFNNSTKEIMAMMMAKRHYAKVIIIHMPS